MPDVRDRRRRRRKRRRMRRRRNVERNTAFIS
jgi:hypothetical protein